MFRSCTLLLFALLSLHSVKAQDSDTNKRFRFGALVAGSANLHAASFGALAGFPSCCPQYSSGSGIAPLLGIFAEIPLSNSLSHILRASLSDLRGDLSSVESSVAIVNNQIVTARVQHSLNVDIKGISIEPDVYFRLNKSIGLFTGLRFEFSLKGDISQKEELIQPEVGTFENGKRIRNEVEGQIFALQPILASAIGGIRWELPMNRDASVLLIPELSVGFALNTVTASEEWRIHTIRLGASIAFQSQKNDNSGPVPYDNTPLQAEINAIPFDGQREFPGRRIQVEEYEHIDVQTLLPFIFFEEGNDVLPVRYASLTEQSIDSFEVQQAVMPSALSSYYSILQIIGKRLRQHSAETISIVGCIDSTESKSADLARRRSDNISRYFQRVWGIDRTRIQTSVRPPDILNAEADPRILAAQNRRVELIASDIILAPLQYRDTTHSVSPRFLRLRPLARGGEGIDHWDIQVTQRGQLIKSFNGNSALPFKLPVDLNESPFLLRGDSLSCLLLVDGRRGGAASSLARQAVDVLSVARKREESIDDTLSVHTQFLNLRHRLIDNSNAQQSTIMRALATRHSTWMYSDYSLSNSSAEVLQQLSMPVQTLQTPAPGRSPYSNTFPESRLYNRCIDVVLKSLH